LAANKVPGIRAALVGDAVTAAGARKWNHANVLALSLRATPLPVAAEILDAWFETPYDNDAWNLKQIARIRDLESRVGNS
jgi:ribose 5-phosphate isomerase B